MCNLMGEKFTFFSETVNFQREIQCGGIALVESTKANDP